MAALRGPRIWVALGVLLAVVLTAAAWLLVIAPARAEVATVRSSVDDATLQQSVLRSKLRELDTAAAGMADLQAQVAAASAALPADVDTAGLLRTVQAAATAAGVVVAEVTVREAVASAESGVWAVPVDVALSGAPGGLLTALGTLQGGAGRLVTVDSGDLQPGTDGASTLALAIRVYTTTPPPGAPAPPGGAAAAAPAAGVGAGAPAPVGAATTTAN